MRAHAALAHAQRATVLPTPYILQVNDLGTDELVRLAAEGVSGPPISAEDEEQYGHVWQAFGAPTG